MSNNMAHPLDGTRSECTQVTIEIARPGRSPLVKSITIMELLGNASQYDLPAMINVVEDMATNAMREAYCNDPSRP